VYVCVCVHVCVCVRVRVCVCAYICVYMCTLVYGKIIYTHTAHTFVELCDLYLFLINVWNKLCRCDHLVLEFESFSPPMK